jgi:hypothetical protein
LIGGEPVKPYNLGEEINGPANETHPAVRMAGFHLLFNSDREGNPYDLYQAKSKRVVRKFDYSKTPTADWFGRNVELLVGLLLTSVLLVFAYLRAFRKPLLEKEELSTSPTSSKG